MSPPTRLSLDYRLRGNDCGEGGNDGGKVDGIALILGVASVLE
jgi:hypothetical protein